MRESRTYGSVRGARGNSRPYREVRQPKSWCDPAGESPVQVKGSVLLGSECCVATGDSGCEAYTAIAWGVGLSHERLDIAGAEGFHSPEGNMCGVAMRGAVAHTHKQSTHWTLSQVRVSQALARIRQLVPSHTRGRSRMRESRTYGSGRGACDETHVPTATRLLALGVFRCGAENFDAMGGTADIDRPPASIA